MGANSNPLCSRVVTLVHGRVVTLVQKARYGNVAKPVICAKSFRTGTVRFVLQSEKFAVERAYGMPVTVTLPRTITCEFSLAAGWQTRAASSSRTA